MTRHDSRPSGPVPIGTCIMVFPLLHVIDNKNDKKCINLWQILYPSLYKLVIIHTCKYINCMIYCPVEFFKDSLITANYKKFKAHTLHES